MKVAVTGAGGFLGRSVVQELARRGHGVRAITRDGTMVAGAEVTLASGDLIEADCARLVDGCGAVINCAARVHVTGQEDPALAERSYRAMNAEFPVRLARAAAHAGVSRLVQLSSAAAIRSITEPGEVADDATPARPASAYGRGKLEADLALAELSGSGTAIVSLRPPTIYGPGVGAFFARLDSAARRGVPLPLSGIDNLRSFAFLGNIAHAVATAAEGGPAGTYVVTDSAPISTASLYRELARLHGHGDCTFVLPGSLVWALAKLALGERATSVLASSAFDGARFCERFAWTPPCPMDMALARTIESTA